MVHCEQPLPRAAAHSYTCIPRRGLNPAVCLQHVHNLDRLDHHHQCPSQPSQLSHDAAPESFTNLNAVASPGKDTHAKPSYQAGCGRGMSAFALHSSTWRAAAGHQVAARRPDMLSHGPPVGRGNDGPLPTSISPGDAANAVSASTTSSELSYSSSQHI